MLAAVDRWRTALAGSTTAEDARRIALRVLFLRICEERGVAARGTLQAVRSLAGLRGWFERAANRWDCAGLEFAAGAVDEAVLARICGEAEALVGAPVELLGQAYERAIAGEASRKARGVVYTPGYVVEAIVARTIGALDGTPRVVDPACGAGAFLLGAYRSLVARVGAARRVEVLRNCVHGVDIDAGAVEVARLSLLLAALIGGELAALPDLGGTIRCEHALLGSSLEARSFGAVIGNPPYVRIQRIGHAEADLLFKNYRTLTSKADLSLAFLERGLELVAADGVVGMICTSQWLTTDYGRELRRVLAGGLVREIVDFGGLPVFPGVTTYPAIVIATPRPGEDMIVRRVTEARQLSRAGIEAAPVRRVKFSGLSEAPWRLGGGSLTDRLDGAGIPWRPLAAFGRAWIGTKSGLAAAFVVEDEVAGRLEPELLLPYAYQGQEVVAYGRVVPRARIIFPYTRGEDGMPVLIAEEVLRSRYPRVHAHLLRWQEPLRARMDSRRRYAEGDDWYRFLRAGAWRQIAAEKIIFKGVARRGVAGVLAAGAAFDGANCPGVVIDRAGGLHRNYFVALLNASVVSEHLKMGCPPKQGGYVRFGASAITVAPIRVLDLGEEEERAAHDRIVAGVERLLGGDPRGEMIAAELEREVGALYGETDGA